MNITKKYILANFQQDLFDDNIYYQSTDWYTKHQQWFYEKEWKIYKFKQDSLKFKKFKFNYLKLIWKWELQVWERYYLIWDILHINNKKDKIKRDIFDFSLIDFTWKLEIVLDIPWFEQKTFYSAESFDWVRDFSKIYNFFEKNNKQYLKIIKK